MDTSMPQYRDEDGYTEWMEMTFPAIRLWLLEKGRREGVSQCNRSHKEETHGDDHYWVTTTHEPGKEGYLVRCARGRNARSHAESKIADCLSSIAKVKAQIKGIDDAKKAQIEADPHQDPEKWDAHTKRQIAELDSRRAPLKEKLEALEATMLAARKVPMPVFYWWLLRF